MTKSGWCMWGGIAVLLLVRSVVAQGGPAATPFKAPVISDTGDLRGPRQPIVFRHMRHIKALGTGPESCANCHGEVAKQPRLYQVPTLKMGWCIRCHVERKVTRDCTACHF